MKTPVLAAMLVLAAVPAVAVPAADDHCHPGQVCKKAAKVEASGEGTTPTPAAAYKGKYPLLPDDQLQQILDDKSSGRRGRGHTDSWLPYTQAQQDALARGIDKGAYKGAHGQAHDLIDQYKSQNLPVEQLKQGVSDIVYGIRGIVDTGLEYVGVKENVDLPKSERRAKLAALDEKMGGYGNDLSDIPMGKNNAHVALMSGMSERNADTSGGLVRIMAKVSGDDHVDDTIASAPNSPGLSVEAGNMQLEAGNPQKAKEYFNNALSLDPSNLQALTGRAAANADLKDFAGAQSDARAALGVDPNDPAALALAAMARDGVAGSATIDKDSPFKKAAEDDAALRGAPGVAQDSLKYLAPANGAGLQSSAYTRQAMRALSVGDADTALRHANRAISLDSKNSDAYGLRAFAHARAGNYESALKDAMAALALDPANTMAHNARAKALNKMGLYNEALHAADDALRANPRNAYAYYMRAMALQGMGDRKGMIAALGAAAALDARYQDAYDLAKSAPAEQDMSFLFPEDQLAAAKAALAAQGGPRPRYFGMTMPVLVIVALVGLAVLYFLTSLIPKARQAYATVVRQGPALGTGMAMGGLPTPPPMPTPRGTQTGTVLRGQYRRLGQIGSSVHGAVFEGVDMSLQRPVAIRKLRAEMRAADRDRLLVPARAAAGLNHANIAPVYAVFDEGEHLYLVSEFAPGRSLRDQLAANGPLSWEHAGPIFRQVAAGLDYSHTKGVAHGAIKASNLMISPEGRVRIIDFGLARGPADAASDLAAFGACLREAIAGISPARLDAVDAALAKSRGGVISCAEILSVVEASLASVA